MILLSYSTLRVTSVPCKIRRVYCKTLNCHVPFMSQIFWGKRNRKIKGHEYVVNVYWWFEVACVLELCSLNLPK